MSDIKYTDKKVDESWKEEVSKEKAPRGSEVKEPPQTSREDSPSEFSQFLTSLAMQALIHLGVMEHPTTRTKSTDLGAAKEMIDLLILLKDKTKGNLTPAESQLMESVLNDLQVRFVQLSGV